MKTLKTLNIALALALVAMTGNAFAQDSNAAPSVDSIIDSLKKDDAAPQAGRTRALRPGAAVSATATAPEPVAKPKPASVSMQINFDFNSDQISASSSKTMQTLARALASPQLQNRKFTIVGHTDGKGSAAYNMALSTRRAAAVKHELVSLGVDAGRLASMGRGKSQLLNKANPEAPENRRVEILATDR